MNDFLPEDYEVPQPPSQYMKLQQGQNRFRALSKPIIGYKVWTTNEDGKRQPKRFRMDENIPVGIIEPGESTKHFWAFVVWNYDASSVQILEITQKSIQKALVEYGKNEDYGSMLNYNVTITKTGEKLDTEYTVMPSPPKPLDNVIKEAYEAMNINLEALFDDGDPFSEEEVDLDAIDKAMNNSKIVEETL